nr:MAG TPA: hypothetical protein [Caudoviricetes sp.]
MIKFLKIVKGTIIEDLLNVLIFLFRFFELYIWIKLLIYLFYKIV